MQQQTIDRLLEYSSNQAAQVAAAVVLIVESLKKQRDFDVALFEREMRERASLNQEHQLLRTILLAAGGSLEESAGT